MRGFCAENTTWNSTGRHSHCNGVTAGYDDDDDDARSIIAFGSLGIFFEFVAQALATDFGG